MATIHAITATYITVNSPAKGEKDWRVDRTASVDIIPSTTDAA